MKSSKSCYVWNMERYSKFHIGSLIEQDDTWWSWPVSQEWKWHLSLWAIIQRNDPLMTKKFWKFLPSALLLYFASTHTRYLRNTFRTSLVSDKMLSHIYNTESCIHAPFCKINSIFTHFYAHESPILLYFCFKI